jgi:hypothetical protein
LELKFDFGIDDIHVDLELEEGRVTDDFFIYTAVFRVGGGEGDRRLLYLQGCVWEQ